MATNYREILRLAKLGYRVKIDTVFKFLRGIDAYIPQENIVENNCVIIKIWRDDG